jgi:DNA gyrase/topoisomerase IV subunit B
MSTITPKKTTKTTPKSKESKRESTVDIDVLEDEYKKLTPLEHCLLRPDSYIGDVKKREVELWVYDNKNECMTTENIEVSLGAMKVVDEILVNARDMAVKFPGQLSKIDVKYDQTTGLLEITDDGPGIPVEMHKDWGKYVMEGIFGDFMAGSNFGKKKKICGGKNGYGSKCISPETLVPLWTGQYKFARDITINDKLIGDDGTIRNITNIIKGTGKMYQIDQIQKGESYVVNEDHILTLHMPDHKVIFWNSSCNGWSVLWWDHSTMNIKKKTETYKKSSIICEECGIELSSNLKRHYNRIHKGISIPKTTRKSPTSVVPNIDDIDVMNAKKRLENFCDTIPNNNTFDISIQDYLKLNNTTQKRLAGLRGDCVNWDKKSVDLDPYILGLWLGDGYSSGYGYACDEQTDNIIIEYFSKWCDENQAIIKKVAHCTHRISSKHNEGKIRSFQNPFTEKLRIYNLIENKHIPLEYLVNDRETRLKLLAGFIDSDGHVSREGTRISISQGLLHKQLINDVVFLARSLGFFCSIKIRNTSWSHKGIKKFGKCFSVNITGDIADIPTLLPRKKCKNNNYAAKTHSSRTTGQIKIKNIENGEFIGLTIDSNQRFLINDFTVTHNCTNAYSRTFYAETRDSTRQLKHVQTWTNNMSEVSKAKVTNWKGKSGVTIRFELDWKRFNMTHMDDNFVKMLEKRVYDLSACTNESVKVYLNGKMIPQKNFDKYISLYIGGVRSGGKRSVKTFDNAMTDETLKQQFENITPEELEMMKNMKWDIAVAGSETGYQQISFVNGITTWKSGTHVNYISKQLVTKVGAKLKEILKKKKKDKINIKPEYIRDHIFLFVNATIVDPGFSSQTKEECTTDPSEFGFKCTLDDEFIDDIIKKCDLEANVIRLAEYKSIDLTKTDGKRVGNVTGIPNFEDAHNAGKKGKSHNCTLLVTEGLSAKTFAVSGFSVVGRDDFGVWPIKGKIFNPRDMKKDKLSDNIQYAQLKQIMGLQDKKKYVTEEDMETLRYRSITLITDQDPDGSHIKGLFFNIFAECWPELLEQDGFFKDFKTPLVKLTKRKEELLFFNMHDFDEWRQTDGNTTTGWNVKYLKGLGSSDPNEAKQYFKDRHKYISSYYTRDLKVTLKKFEEAFGKNEADTRKIWLGESYDNNNVLDQTLTRVSYDDFIDKELVHFFKYNTERNIPNICDGLKTGQRKVVFTCRKRNITKDTKVFQLAGEVAKTSAYHHGDASLNSTIVGLAQDYTGSNNLNILVPSGEFGSRTAKGGDASAARYIHTRIDDVISYIFPKEDDPLLEYCVDDDGNPVEPTCFIPIIPLILINGCAGTGCGFSTSIPSYNPREIIENLKLRLDNKQTMELKPWYRDYIGTIEKEGPSKYVSKGSYKKLDATKLRILELPIGFSKDTKSFIDYLEFLESSVINPTEKDDKKRAKMFLKAIKNDYTRENCDFTLTFPSAEELSKLESTPDKLEDKLNLKVTINTTNMYLFDKQGKIEKYNTINDIFEKYFKLRLELYEKRREYNLKEYKIEIDKLQERIRFLELIMDNKLNVYRVSQDILLTELKKHSFKIFDNDSTYDYLLKQTINRFTNDELNKIRTNLDTEIQKYKQLECMTPVMIWKDELKELERLLTIWEKRKIEDKTSDGDVDSATKLIKKRKIKKNE